MKRSPNYNCPMCGLETTVLEYKKKGSVIFDTEGDFIKFKDFYKKKDINKANLQSGILYASVKLGKDCLAIYCQACQYSWCQDTIQNQDEKDPNG